MSEGAESPDAVLRTFLDGLLGDPGVEVLDDVAVADVCFESVTGDSYEGRQQIKQVLRESMGAYEEVAMELEWAVAEGDRVVAATTMTARPSRGILGIPPPDEALSITALFDGVVEDGRLTYLRQTLDTRQMMPQAVRRGRGAVLQGMRDGVVVLDDRELVVDANPAALELLLDAERKAVLGEPLSAVLGEEIDLAPDAGPTDVERDGRIYEVRTSPIFAEGDEAVGHTLVARDVTERERRERRLATQRDELETLSDLNAVLRGVNQVLVSATAREEIERAVCDRLAATELFDTVCIGDVRTWTGEAERWTVAGERDPGGLELPELGLPAAQRSDGGAAARQAPVPAIEEPAADWTVVPIVYGGTVYGAIGLHTEREDAGERELAVLAELGETIGHAINAVETRRLLSAEATVALELASTDAGDPLVAATGSEMEPSPRYELTGLVPAGEGTIVAYLDSAGSDLAAAVQRLDAETTGVVRRVGDDGDGSLEWRVGEDTPLAALLESGAHVEGVVSADGVATYDVRVASDADVRSLVGRVTRRFPDVRLEAKSEESGPPVAPDAVPGAAGEFTPRQRSALEAAYRAGYFEWPRESTAEEVAETLDIAPSTLHSHLRKAEASVVGRLFDDGE